MRPAGRTRLFINRRLTMGALAHVAHWYAELLYVAPVVAVAGWLALSGRRERRRGDPPGGVQGGRGG